MTKHRLMIVIPKPFADGLFLDLAKQKITCTSFFIQAASFYVNQNEEIFKNAKLELDSLSSFKTRESAFNKSKSCFLDLLNKKQVLQSEIARTLNVNKTLVYRWASGKSLPNLRQLQKLKEVLGEEVEAALLEKKESNDAN